MEILFVAVVILLVFAAVQWNAIVTGVLTGLGIVATAFTTLYATHKSRSGKIEDTPSEDLWGFSRGLMTDMAAWHKDQEERFRAYREWADHQLAENYEKLNQARERIAVLEDKVKHVDVLETKVTELTAELENWKSRYGGSAP